MISISDAIPVQFWINGVESFNIKIEPGIDRQCFNQLFNADDEIRIQFTDDDDLLDYLLLIENVDGDIIATVPFQKVDDLTYELTFTPEDEGITNEKIKLTIYAQENVSQIISPEEWVNTFAANPLIATPTQLSEAIVTGSNWGADQPLTVDIPLNATLEFDIVLEVTGTWTGDMTIAFMIDKTGGGGLQTGITVLTISANQGPTTHRISILKAFAQAVPESLVINITNVVSGTANVVITLPVGAPVYFNEEDHLAYSDFLSIKVNHPRTKLIRVSNEEDYAGIIYNTIYPDLVNGSFAGSLSPSTSEGAGNAWTWTGAFSGSAMSTLPASSSPTARLRLPLAMKAGMTYRFEVAFRNNDGGGGAGNYTDVKLYLTDGVDFSNVHVEAGLPLGNTVFIAELEATEDWLYVEITAEANNVGGQLREVLTLGVVLESPVGVRTAPDFGIRVEAKFFKERNPEENESEELSTGSVVKLLGTAKKQKLLQVMQAPFYLHRKLTYILQHNTIYIDNLAWLKEENYETEELDERNPFVTGKTYMTQKDNSYVTNPFS